MYISKPMKKVLSLLMSLVMILTCLPATAFVAGAAPADGTLIIENKVADPSTIDWEAYFGPNKMDTEFAGGVWTDKSVFTGATSELPGVTMDNSNNFLVALSTISSNVSISGYSSSPTDTMLVLDVSGSMVDDTFTVGYTRANNNRYNAVTAIDMSLIEGMVDATNNTIDKLMDQNSNNRVGVVLYSGNTTTGSNAAPSSATVVLPLGRYADVNGQYLTIDANYVTQALYQRNGNRYTQGSAVTYVANGQDVDIETVRNLKTESGATVSATSKQVVGGTYIQNGLYQAMQQFLAVEDTTVPEGNPQAGAERQPVLVLMSDGAPTICTNDYSGNDSSDANIGNSNYGNGSATQEANRLNRIAVMTQLTAAYVRGRVAAHYQETAQDKKDFTFLTLGLGTGADVTATATLYPAGSSTNITRIWNTYLAAADKADVTLSGTGFDGNVTVRRHSEVEALNYVDKYFYADNADELVDSFNQIITEIELKAESYSTLVEGDSADLSGYVTIEDELGQMMQVSDVKGVLMSDGQGGKVLYTGLGIAKSLTTGNLGTIDNPNARGDELVNTVRERIPGLSTSTAQQLIGYAYEDRQLYYANDTNWSNYIGWYAKADGSYAGFWDKDTGYENAPADAVYANRSYGYLGVNGDSDMMHVVVLVRTNLKTLDQTVFFKIPAALLPTVQYHVTINESDPTKVDSFSREDAIPMQLVLEVGLREDINSVNLQEKIAEHVAAGGHVHHNDDGTVTFYTNAWDHNNDTNNNGLPDAYEVADATVTKTHFHPAMDNSRYYYTEDTPILDASGNTVGGRSRPSGQYYHHRYIYNQTQRTTLTMPVSADTLQNHAKYNEAENLWYIPAGTIFSEVSRFRVDKTRNTTNTLAYSDFPAVFPNGNKQDVYAFLGNNGALTVAPAQGIALTKTVSEANTDAGAPTEFTFHVELSQAVDNPVITDTEGNLLTGIASVDGKVITVKLTAGQTVVISNIPTGTTYTVTEETTQYYKATSANASGTVAAYTVHAVDFVNTAKHFGSLIVGKDVNYPENFAPGAAHNSKQFAVHVTFTGDTEDMVVPRGAVKDGNTYTLSLQDGQSATFSNIPEGVTYTVTEDNIPEGYAHQETRYSDTEQTIHGQDLDTVDVVNTYTQAPVTADLQIQGTKTVTGGWPDGAEFTVRLWQVYDFASGEVIKTDRTATVTASNASYSIDISDVEFTTVGTYYIRVAEDIPEDADRIDNMAYDRTMGLFSITVTDDDADGKLEIHDGAVVGYQGTPVTGNGADGWTVTKDFTNVVTKDLVYLDIEKSLTGYTGTTPPLADITFGLFTDKNGTVPQYYSLTNAQGEATLMIPVTKDVLDDNGGQIIYYLREIAPAIENRVTGMNYDESWLYAIRITWDDAQNKAVVAYAPMDAGEPAPEAYLPYDRETVSFTHTNSYVQNVTASVQLNGNKTLNGSTELGGREFSFSLYHSTAAFVKGALIRTVSNSGSTIDFGTVTFPTAGIYYLVAEENATELGGVTIDPTVYHITVEVEKFTDSDNVTKLRIVDGYPTVVAFGSTDNVGKDNLNFHNTYTVTGFDDVAIGGKKTLTGRALSAGEFQVGLYSDATCRTLLETASNRANGTFSFTGRTYTAADLGPNYTAKTYNYYAKEIVPAGATMNTETGKYEYNGVAYDPTVYEISVSVKDNGSGQIVAETTARILGGATLTLEQENVVQLDIQNTYSAKPTGITLVGSKHLSGNWDQALQVTNEFYFDLYAADASYNVTNDTPITSVTTSFDPDSADRQKDFSIHLSYQDGQEGSYYYVLKEDFVHGTNGVNYDAGEYLIRVNVTDPGNGQLVATATMYRPGAGNTSTAIFTNRYAPQSTQLVLDGTKAYINSATSTAVAQTEGMFTFSVLDGETIVATGKNLADGTIEFTPITFTAAGTYQYTVVENDGDIGGVTYDPTAIPVTIHVVDNGDGTMTASADYGTTPIAFENSYTPETAQVIFNGEKFLTGDWSVADKDFMFELYETGEDYAVTGDPIDYAHGTEGAFTFGAQTYTTPKTHYYVICEENSGVNGVDYDPTQYQIRVDVVDNGAGSLIPTVTAVQNNVTVSADPGNASLVTIENLSFTNHYQATPATFTPKVQKIYEREATEEMKAFSFVLTVNGNPKQTKTNNDAGEVTFETLTFPTPGVYELTIREQETTLFGLIRWDLNVYTISLHVEDNGQGQLFVNQSKTTITSDKGRDDLIFRNAHHDVITKKDVFQVTAPTVSIDGKAVEANDVLLYTISYTNYDSIPVNIQILDEIPQYTTYVGGSADKGGTLDGNTVKWLVSDIKPDETVTVSFQVKVDDTTNTLVNDATILEGNNTYTTNTVTNPVKEDTIQKDVFRPSAHTVSIDGETVEVNEILLYKVTYTNADDAAATVTITDTIPQYTSYVDGSADKGGVYSEGTLTWTLPLVAGESQTVSFQVKVENTNITVENQATAVEGENTLTSNKVYNPVEEDTFEKDVFLKNAPTVSIDGNAVEVNDILLYKLTYTNADDAAATVTITDTIPQYTTYVDGSADNGGVYSEGTLTWTLPLAGGESKTISFQVKVTGQEGQTIVNQASSQDGKNTLHTEQVTNPIKEDTIVKDVFLKTAPTVSIDEETVEVNDILLYKVTYTNADDAPATVTITDTIPQYTTYVDGSADNGGVYSEGTLTWTLPLAGGESKTVSFQVKVVDTQITVVNQASGLDGVNKIDSNVVRNPVEEDLIVKDVSTVAEPTVSIDGKDVNPGQILRYTLTYTNTDGAAATVIITDTIPQYTTYVDGSADNDGTYNEGVVTWSLPLAAGESKTVSFLVKVTGQEGQTIVNQASGLDGENTVHTEQITNPIKEDIIEKDVFLSTAPTVTIDGKPVNKGQILLYKVTYTNTDDLAATVTVTDAIPQYTTYVDGSADNDGTYNDGVLTWTLQLAAGQSKTVSFQVKVTAPNVTVENKATGYDGVNRIETNVVTSPVENDTVKKDVFLKAAPTVSIDGKAVNKDDTLIYTITYTNADISASTVTITDVIPQYTTYVDGSADNGGVFSEGQLTWTLQLAAGQSKTVSFQVKVTDYNVTINNQAITDEAGNKLLTNIVTNKTGAPPETPKTGDSINPLALTALMGVSTVCLFVLILSKKHLLKKENEV